MSARAQARSRLCFPAIRQLERCVTSRVRTLASRILAKLARAGTHLVRRTRALAEGLLHRLEDPAMLFRNLRPGVQGHAAQCNRTGGSAAGGDARNCPRKLRVLWTLLSGLLEVPDPPGGVHVVRSSTPRSRSNARAATCLSSCSSCRSGAARSSALRRSRASCASRSPPSTSGRAPIACRAESAVATDSSSATRSSAGSPQRTDEAADDRPADAPLLWTQLWMVLWTPCP